MVPIHKETLEHGVWLMILLMPKCIQSGPWSVFSVLPNRYFKDGRIVGFSRVDQQFIKQKRKELCALEINVCC